MKKTVLITAVAAVVALIVLMVISRSSGKEDKTILYVDVKQGDFEIVVTTTGELQAENSLDIKAPDGLQSRNLRFGGIRIQDLVAEGTVVKQGDYVARLDRSEADNNFKDELDRLESFETDYNMKKLDTTINLGNLRDDLVNLEYNMEEAEVTLEQSKYEPPTTIRQARIQLDKTSRALDQAKSNYGLKVQQAKADVKEAQLARDKQQRKVSEMQAVLDQFVILAPAPGMVIYKREWGGAKRKVGSTISPWDPVVATLPDLSSMISKTYVNEIDISKIKIGQPVRLGIDAFPEKKYTGAVMSVANIGEQLPNTDAKVFEVVVRVNESDPIMRPSMTTSNKVVTGIFKDVLFIPLESVHAGIDSIPFVYKKDGTRQVVVLGESNENEVIVEQGLESGERLYLNTPIDAEGYKLVGEELIDVIREKIAKKKSDEEKRRQEGSVGRTDRQGMQNMNLTPEQIEKMRQMGGSGQGGQRTPGSGQQGQRPAGTTTNQGANNPAGAATVKKEGGSPE